VLFAGEDGMLIHSDKLTYHKGRERGRVLMMRMIEMRMMMVMVIIMMMVRMTL
jgi:hypothetical protein